MRISVIRCCVGLNENSRRGHTCHKLKQIQLLANSNRVNQASQLIRSPVIYFKVESIQRRKRIFLKLIAKPSLNLW